MIRKGEKPVANLIVTQFVLPAPRSASRAPGAGGLPAGGLAQDVDGPRHDEADSDQG